MEYLPSYKDDLYLVHHGIKGQKWGVRRYQNTDGTYTSQGKNRRNKALKKITNKLSKLDDKTKKKIIKGLGTAAVLGGIAAYGKANGGKGPVDSYIKGITTGSNKLSGYLIKQSAKRRNQAKTKYDDTQDGPTYTKNGKIVDDIPDEVLEKEFAKQRSKSIKHSDLYLAHHGIKGMRWGVRRFEDANGHLTPEGKRRYAIQDARKYYKINRLQRAQEKNRDPDKNERLSKRIRRVQTRSDRKHADLSQRDINIGRQIVSKNRRNWAMVGTAAKAGLTAAGAYALYQNPKTRALAPLAIAVGSAATQSSAKKLPYYTMEARRYKQVNPKGATNKGLTKKQKALRKAGKIAAGAALAGAAGYALYKTGAGKSAIDAGKRALESRTGINVGKNSSRNLNSDSSIRDSSHKIYEAAKGASKAVKSKNSNTSSPRDSSHKIYEAAKGAAGAMKSKARSAVRNRVVNGVDENDPRTWITAARNAKDTVSDVKRYGRAINKMRKGDAVGAAAEVSDELTDTANKLIEGTQSRIDKAKSGRGSRKSKLK